MSKVSEYTVLEAVTAVIQPETQLGEYLQCALSIGYYKASPDAEHEIWIDQGDRRVQFFASDIPLIVKQLKRAAAIAKEQKP